MEGGAAIATTTGQTPTMEPAFSLYLDLARFVCALLVVASHIHHVSDVKFPLSFGGHASVIVFFVLSGYVIAYVSETKERSLRSYAVSRMARIYSVALPAAAILPLLYIIGASLDGSLYGLAGSSTSSSQYLLELTSIVAFFGQCWTFAIEPFKNIPYWSLPYEVTYYIIYGIALFSTGCRRLILLSITCITAGPKIVLLLPIWYFGVTLYKVMAQRGPTSLSLGIALILSSFFGIISYRYYNISSSISHITVNLIGPTLYKDLIFSKYFLEDYLIGSLVALNFLGAKIIGGHIASVPPILEKSIKWLSSHTFTLYAFHLPLLFFFTALLNKSTDRRIVLTLSLLSMFVSIWLLAKITENKRQWYRNVIAKCLPLKKS